MVAGLPQHIICKGESVLIDGECVVNWGVRIIQLLGVTFYSLCRWTKFLKFDIMQVQVDIEFEQLVQLAKRLPAKQWTKLKQEVEAQVPADNDRENFKKLLLSGPTFSKKQLDAVAKTRKEIDQWRVK